MIEKNPCRFCGTQDKQLFSLVLQVGRSVLSTYACLNCMNLIKDLSVTLYICTYCGNLFYVNEISTGDIILVPTCGICEKGGQILKNV